MLSAIGRFVLRARTFIVVAYALVVPVAAFYGADVLHELQPGGFRDPGAESTIEANEGRKFVAGDLVVLYTAKSGSTVEDVEAYTNIVPALANVERDSGVERVVSFYSTGAPWLVSKDRTRTIALANVERDSGVERVVSFYSTGAPWLVSKDRTRTIALVTLKGVDVEKVATMNRVKTAFNADGFDVSLGGYAPVFQEITSTVERDLRRAELLAMPLTLILLLLLFRSVISAALPVVLGGIAIAFSLAILRALHSVSEVTIFAANVATILGLGLAIDYSLFVLMRFREELPKSSSTTEAVVRAMETAGRAVAFSGITVAVSLCGLFMFPHGVLRSVAVGGIAVTIATVLLATTLLPALLAFLGPRVDALRVPFGLPLPSEIDEDKGAWVAIASFVMKRPVIVGGVVVAGLVVCGLPFVRLAPSVADARSLPRGDEAREVSAIIDREFASHFTTPHEIIVALDDPNASWSVDKLHELTAYAKRVQTVPGIASTFGPHSLDPMDADRAVRIISADDDASRTARALFVHDRNARITAVSTFNVDDERALDQVELIRRVTPPAGSHVLVGGQSAWIVDVRDALRLHTPAMVIFIALSMTLVLFFVFGSIVIPLKAIAMNLLSLTASFGAIVWVFQDGRLTSVFGYDPLPTTEASVPVLMFAIVFGLSMDYEVLLLSRVREEYLASGDNAGAVALGLSRTGRLITSAALLLVVVVSCFATSQLVFLQTLAVGIAVAIFLDATVVRTLLVPATMRLLGSWNWWAPEWMKSLAGGVSRAGRDKDSR